MTNTPDITPPPELVEEWANDSVPMNANAIGRDWERAFAARSAQWGADQELEAIQKEIITQAWFADPGHRLAQLRAARRPKPLSLKEQALYALDEAESSDCLHLNGLGDTIRRALEALDD